MADPYPRSKTSNLTPALAGAALFMAGYLVLDRIGVFEPAPKGEPRPVAARGDLMSLEQTTIKIFEDNKPSVVHITRMSRGAFSQPTGTGSGFVWDTQGHIVTNHHVVKGAQDVVVRFADRREYVARIVHSDPSRDIAVLRFQGGPRNLRPVVVGSSHDLRVGQSVFALGNPFGLQLTFTKGIVSALDRTITTEDRSEQLHNLIQTDAAINPGNSGGPLFDSAGRLVGMNTALVSRSGSSAGIGFAVPIDVINQIVPDLIERRTPMRAVMGVYLLQYPVRLAPGTVANHTYAVGIERLNKGFGAEAAGLRPLQIDRRGEILAGDAILMIEATSVESPGEVMGVLKKHLPGQAVKVKVVRFAGKADPRVETVTIKLAGVDQ